MEARRVAEQGEDPDTELPGWCIGSEAFRKELQARMSERKGPEHFGKEIRESAEEKATRITRHALKRAGCVESDLGRRRKGDPIKLKIALRPRDETTMTLAWIARRLEMGTKTYLSHLLYWQHRKGVKSRDAS